MIPLKLIPLYANIFLIFFCICIAKKEDVEVKWNIGLKWVKGITSDALQAKLQSSINFLKSNYYYRKISKKLSDPSTSLRCCLTLLKTLLNGRKIPFIPPLFQDDRFITDFKEKSEIFNSFFAKQCSLINNGSTLPTFFPLITEKSLSDVDFSVDDIKNIISKLDSNKAYGDDRISIRMLKLCDKSICKLLSIVFKSCLTQGIFPSEWKKANVVPIHKKPSSSVLQTTDISLFSQSVAKF